MHLYRKWILPLAALAVWTASARPDEAKETYIPKEDSIQVILLRHKAVRDDLKLTEGEANKINEFATRQWEKAREIAGLGEEKRHEKFPVFAKENEKFIEDTLNAEQRKRLHQITMQVAGLMCVTSPDVASELNLTDEQKTKARELQKQSHKEMHAVFQTDGKEGQQEKFKELCNRSRERLQSLLTDDQKATWTKLAGEKFTGDLFKE